MSKVVAIISEYNPFHLGHEYHINKVREEFGDDTVIVAIMSGNYTQRAEPAFADKLLRASAAVECGVNLVLELPFPYSSSSAEFFASAGVAIANALGVVDVISFGSESGDIFTLKQIAGNMLSEEYQRQLDAALASKEFSGMGHAAISEAVYRSCFSSDASCFTTPNNILALEYIKAIIISKSNISPHTVKRIGGAYKSKEIMGAEFPSASAIRDRIFKNDMSAFDFIPKSAKNIFLDKDNKSSFPCNAEKLSSAFLSFFRLNSSPAKSIFDAEGGLYNRLSKLSFKANSISHLTDLATTKKYTVSRIRRAMLFSFFGVTSSNVKKSPRYTQVLAMDNLGAKLLREIKKKGEINIITKPSVIKGLDDDALAQKRMADSADTVFQLTKPSAVDGSYHLTFTPYIKI